MIDERVVLARVDAYGPPPVTTYDALFQAHALLSEEGRWMQGEFFEDGSAMLAYENGSICGEWSCCALGAVGLVTGELQIVVNVVEVDSDELEDQYVWDERGANSLDVEGLSGKCWVLLSDAAADYGVEQWIKDNVGLEHATSDDWENALSERGYFNIVEFNDHWQVDRDDVLAVFESAMEKAQGQA